MIFCLEIDEREGQYRLQKSKRGHSNYYQVNGEDYDGPYRSFKLYDDDKNISFFRSYNVPTYQVTLWVLRFSCIREEVIQMSISI